MDAEASPADREFMRRALELAERGWGRVHPNPLVGAIVVRDGAVVGEGFHGEYGGPHAEVVALAAAGARARGATLYVGLEPCSHLGKTPPCTDAIRAAGIDRLVFGAADPTPLASGGAAALRAASVQVVGPIAEDEVRAQSPAFFHAAETESSYLALKYALSLDARLGAKDGRPTAVTGALARDETHRLRAGFDAIMVGIGTALADDPMLTVRGAVRPRRPPARIIVDSRVRLSPQSRLARTIGDAPLLVCCAADADDARRAALEAAGARVVTVRTEAGRVDVGALMDRLWSEGIRSVFCEGGGRLGASLLAIDRVQRMYLFYAPRIFGAAGPPAFPAAAAGPSDGRWTVTGLRAFPPDFLCTLDRRRRLA